MTCDLHPFHPADLPALYRICLLTGDNGQDASRQYSDPDLLGHYYAGPYAILEPDYCLVLTLDGEPAGYILGTPDSRDFARRCEELWFPGLRRRYLPDRQPAGINALAAAGGDPAGPAIQPGRDQAMIRLIHEGYSPPGGIQDYPAHLHIDLLPAAQGGGNGRRLMDAFLERLRQAGCPGVHLGVGSANERGIRFYERYGYACLAVHEGWRLMGLRL